MAAIAGGRRAAMKIGIVGMGAVGASVAISTLQSGIATTLLVHDIDVARAEGEALDLAQGSSFYPTATVHVSSLDGMVDADAIVITAGRASRAGETRLDLLRDNATTVRTVARALARARGLLVVVSNPVDVMTLVATDASGLPPARVCGTGTMLDTARLRQMIGRELSIDPRSVHAHVVGEHGDSEVMLWSSAQAGGAPLRRWAGWTDERETALANEVRHAAYEIIARKGATNHAIGVVTAAFLRAALRDEHRVLTVSRVQDGACGIRGVALSLPAVVSARGATHIVEPIMSSDEMQGLQHSANVLQAAAALLPTSL